MHTKLLAIGYKVVSLSSRFSFYCSPKKFQCKSQLVAKLPKSLMDWNASGYQMLSLSISDGLVSVTFGSNAEILAHLDPLSSWSRSLEPSTVSRMFISNCYSNLHIFSSLVLVFLYFLSDIYYPWQSHLIWYHILFISSRHLATLILETRRQNHTQQIHIHIQAHTESESESESESEQYADMENLTVYYAR